MSVARGEISLPSLAFGNSTFEESLFTEVGASTMRDSSTTRRSRFGEESARSGKMHANIVNTVGDRRRRRDSSMIERWTAGVTKV